MGDRKETKKYTFTVEGETEQRYLYWLRDQINACQDAVYQISIITAIITLKKPIILLDEPEAFLHPPQAMQLGRIISNLVDESQQIFVSTHSADFLRGLLGATKDSVIIHLDRNDSNVTEAKILDPEALNQIVTDPLLSSSRVLEGIHVDSHQQP